MLILAIFVKNRRKTAFEPLDLTSRILKTFSVFCKETLKQLGKTDLENSHLRLLVYTGDEDDVVAMSDYYDDYAKALDIMIEQNVEDIDDDEFAEDSLNDNWVKAKSGPLNRKRKRLMILWSIKE